VSYGSATEAESFGAMLGWTLREERPTRTGISYVTRVYDIPAARDLPAGRVSVYMHDNRTEFMFWWGNRTDGVMVAERRARAFLAAFPQGEERSPKCKVWLKSGRQWEIPVMSTVVIRKPTEEPCSTSSDPEPATGEQSTSF